MEFTYTIRDDVTWSDGEPLTADDVAYTLNLYKHNHAYLPQGYLTLIDGEVTALDATHIQFRTKAADGPVHGQVPVHVRLHPAQAHLRGHRQAEAVRERAQRGERSLHDHRVRGRRVRPAWSATRTGPGPEPAVDELIYRIYKTEDALAQALKQGEVDFAYFDVAEHLQLAQGPAEHRHDGRDRPVLLGDRHEHRLRVPGALRRLRPARRRPSRAHRPDRPSRDPDGDQQRGAPRRRCSSGTASRGTRSSRPSRCAGARWTPTGDDVIPWDIPGANQLLDDAGYARYRRRRRSRDAARLARPRPTARVPLLRADERADVGRRRAVRLRVARPDRDQGRRRGGDLGTPRRHHQRGDVRPLLVGLVPRPRPVRRAQRVHRATSDRRTARPTATTTPTTATRSTTISTSSSRPSSTPTQRWEIVHEMQKIFYEDCAYAVMWYDPLFQAYRTDRFTGYSPQPEPKGDLLQGYGGPSAIWTTLKPVSGTGDGTASPSETKGLSAAVWLDPDRRRDRGCRGCSWSCGGGAPPRTRPSDRADGAPAPRSLMRGYLIGKVIQAMLTLLFVITFNFFLFRIVPGDPAALLLRGTSAFNPDSVGRAPGGPRAGQAAPAAVPDLPEGHGDAELRTVVLPARRGRLERDRRQDLADDPAGRDGDVASIVFGLIIGIYGGLAARERVRRRVARVHAVRVRDAGVLVRDPRPDGVRRGRGTVPRDLPDGGLRDARRRDSPGSRTSSTC